MEALLILVFVIGPIALVIWLTVQANRARDQIEELTRRLTALELRQSDRMERAATPAAAAAPVPAATAPNLADDPLHRLLTKTPPEVVATAEPAVAPADVPPLLKPVPIDLANLEPTPIETTPADLAPAAPGLFAQTAPPPVTAVPPQPAGTKVSGSVPPRPHVAPTPAPTPALPAINWENFLGVKLFAWIGGLLLFLGVAFFIKHAFDNNLIKPPLRIALGYLTGAGLLIGAWRLNRERYAVLLQTLCAAAVLIFYGNTFAAHGMYDLIPQIPAFGLMTLVTALAFTLAARLKAQVVAILGMLGGFLTPVLLPTGRDQPAALFTYIALLDTGLIAVALRQRWNHLVLLGWLGTALMQFGWVTKFYSPDKILTAMAIFTGFSALFVAAFVIACRRGRDEKFSTAAALLAPGAALVFAFMMVTDRQPGVTDRPAMLFTFVLLAAGGWLALANTRASLRPAHLAGAAAVTFLLGIWSLGAPTSGMLNTAFGLYLLLALLFVGLFALARRRGEDDQWSTLAGAGAAGAALVFALFVLGKIPPAAFPKPQWFFGYVFLADLGLLAMAALRDRLRPIHLGAGGAVFLLLSLWTAKVLTPALMYWALGIYLVFAVLHSVYPVALERLRPGRHPVWWAHLFPAAALLLLLMPLLKFETSPIILWPVVLLVDLLAIALAAATASLLSVAAVLVLTLGITGCWILRIPPELTGANEPLLVIGGFSLVFFAASLWVTRKVLPQLAAGLAGDARFNPGTEALTKLSGGNPMAHLPALSALLPFMLLIMLTTRLALPDPSLVFGLAAVLLLLLLGVVRFCGAEALCAVGLAASFLLQQVWHGKHFMADHAALALAWHLGFPALLLVFPFLFRERFRDRTIPWAAAALALPLHFHLIHGTVKSAWLADWPGLVPAALAVPLLAGLGVLARWLPADAPKRNTLLALFGGAALFFITLVFPIQLNRQWLTIAWALEGAALLWLFHRVPHHGLRIAGTLLLLVAFARLGLNPAVFDYAARSTTPIFNWYLYSYGLVTVALFAALRLSAPPLDRLAGINLRALFGTLGTVLAFLLLNIEIADYFSTGPRIEFRFSGSFQRDMTYSLSWAVFAGILLAAGVRQKTAPVRYAGLGLLIVTLVKLFLHDLWQLRGLYRIGSLIGLAVTLMLVSFAYQKFLSNTGKKDEPSV